MTSPAGPRIRQVLEEFARYFETEERSPEENIKSFVGPILELGKIEDRDLEDIVKLRGRISAEKKGLTESDKGRLLKKIEELVDSYFPQKERWPILRWFLPKKDISALLKRLLEIENPQMRQEAFKILDSIPQKERTVAIDYIILLFKDIEQFSPNLLFQALQEIDENQRGKAIAAAMPILIDIKDVRGRAEILRKAGLIDMHHR